MVKNKFAVMTLTSLALTLNAGAVRAEDDAMFSMDDGFGSDSVFDVDAGQKAQQSNTTAVEAVSVQAEEKSAAPAKTLDADEEDPFAAMSASLAPSSDAQPKNAVAPETTGGAAEVSAPAEVPAIDNLDDADAFSRMQSGKKDENTSVADHVLGSADNSVFREMAAIERETALLELKAKREKLISEIENSRANLRRNQLEELERREQITRNRINWEVEQEQAAKRSSLEIEQARREMERQDRLEAEQRKEALERKLAEAEMIKKSQDSPSMPSVGSDEGPDEDISSLYTIEEVRGVGGELYATLLSTNGSINVREGYPLKSGYKVSKITTSFVEVRKGDKVELLRFANKGSMSN